MAVLNGTTKRLSIGGQTIGDEFQSVLDVNLDLPTTDSKDDLGWSTHIQGVRSGSLTVACFSNPENTIDFETITGYIITKQTVSFSFDDGIYNITGTGIIQDASEIAGAENATRYDIDIMIDGAIVQSLSISYLLLETGDFFLLETGDKLILE